MIIESQFKPVWWLRNRHVQTIWQKVDRYKLNCPVEEQRLELPDGDFIDLAWTSKPTEDDSRPIVMVLHGLEGSIDSTYAKGMMNAIRDKGWIGVLMHFRGCSKEINRNHRLYHSGETQDISFVSQWLMEQYPQQSLACIGFSLGANALVKFLGETPNNAFTASVAICPPLDLAASAKRIRQGFSWVYQKYLLDMMKATFSRKILRSDLSHLVQIEREQLDKIRTLEAFDDAVTAPLHGFKNAQDYYNKCSGKQFLRYIQRPTLILHAKDDPFLSATCIPSSKELSHRVTYELSEFGGHVGYVNGESPLKVEYWLEQRSLQYIANHLTGV
ncbi:hydrolase [Saccharobesus litoralis]|uniref:Hydrolase n=1 Tax=Saccharobesus litoralis TaxID=2172099 RepID=A0A2S0VW41_9ALTE|nr:hydrolase [Saccharobesus litoralis]AWB68428.1 hydrolase [Saccharobesus litoralis]